MPSPADALLLSIAQGQLLDPKQASAIRGWADERQADATTALKELMTRGWLTSFQVREIARGKTRELTIGPYTLIDLLGEGGMGRVYKARHTRLGRDVALKVIRKDKLSNPNVVARFEKEIHAAAQLNHPNVVMAFDAESSDENLFFTMEYVEGTDLTKLVQKHGAMPLPHACDAVRQAAIGLQHAFERGLVHRDIKPSNLLYTPRGQVKLLDLGLALLNQAAIPGGANANRVTQEGFVLGSPDFLAPEQAQNPTTVDVRADIYGLGATLYYLLTARVPFDGQTPTEKLMKHITEPPPNLLAYRPDAPPQLAAIIQWMMAKRPEDRPQTPAQVAAALTPFGLPQSASLPVPHAPRPVAPAPVGPAVAQFAQPITPPTAVHTPLPHSPPPPPNAFEDLDVDDRPSSRRRDEPADDQPRRRRGETRVTAPKKQSSLPLVLIGLGAVFTVCAGVCIGGGFLVSQWLEASKPLEEEFITDVGGIKLVKIDPGSFDMGSEEAEVGHEPHEGPQRVVTISQAFYIGTTEITRQQYTEVTDKSLGSAPPRMSKVIPRLPATVSWNEADGFFRKLNEKERSRRSGWEFRLPTEAEWEYCARAGRKAGPFGAKARLVQYRDGIFKLDEMDWYGESNPDPTLGRVPYQFEQSPCGINPTATDDDYIFRREPNPWGLYDMAGNVWELCRDRYDRYPAGSATDPTGPAGGTSRVARGGAFDTTATQCRAAARLIVENPNRAKENVGFRVVYGPKLADK